MDLNGMLEQAGIKLDDIKELLRPAIADIVNVELAKARDSLVETVQGQLAEANRLAESRNLEAKASLKDELAKLLPQQGAGTSEGNNSKGLSRLLKNPEIQDKVIDKVIDRVLGSDDERVEGMFDRAIIKPMQRLQTIQQSLAPFQPAQPSPELIFKSYFEGMKKGASGIQEVKHNPKVSQPGKGPTSTESPANSSSGEQLGKSLPKFYGD